MGKIARNVVELFFLEEIDQSLECVLSREAPRIRRSLSKTTFFCWLKTQLYQKEYIIIVEPYDYSSIWFYLNNSYEFDGFSVFHKPTE